MAVLSTPAVRARIAAAIEAVNGLKESRWPYEALTAFGAEPKAFAHGTFAVGIPSTDYQAAYESSQTRRGAAGALARSSVVVRYLHSMRADAGAAANVDAAMTVEASIAAAVLASTLNTSLHISADRVTRSLIADGELFLIELTFTADHRVAN